MQLQWIVEDQYATRDDASDTYACETGAAPSLVTAACDPEGRTIFRARGNRIIVDAIEDTTDGPVLRHRCDIEAGGPVQALACGSDGRLYVAVGEDGPSRLLMLRGKTLFDVARLTSPIRQLVSTHRKIAALLAAGPSSVQRLLVIDPRSGKAERDLPVAGEITRLRASGDGVLLVDRTARQVRRVGLRDECRSDPPDQRPPAELPPDRRWPGTKPGSDCCGPQPGADDPGSRRRRPPRRPPADDCRPGDDGLDEGCWLTLVMGSQIVRINRCDPDRQPCMRPLFTRIRQIERVAGELLVLGEGGRSVIRMDPVSLSVIERRHVRQGAGFLLAAARDGVAFAFAEDGALLARIQVPAAAPGSGLLAASGDHEKVVEGTSLLTAEPGPSFAVEPLRLLIVPVVEPGQNYADDNLLNFAETMSSEAILGDEAPIPTIQRYYHEQSRDAQDLEVEIFGVDTPDWHVGGPVALQSAIADFYNPTFVNGGIVMRPSLGSLPVEVGFSGAERRDITAISAVNATGSLANQPQFELVFPAGIMGFGLGDNGLTLTVNASAADLRIEYVDRAGANTHIDLDPSVLAGTAPILFDAASIPAAVDDLRAAIQAMITSADVNGDFAPVEVRRVKTGDSLGQVNILFFLETSGGSASPRITSLDTAAARLEAILGLSSGAAKSIAGSARFDPSAPDGLNADSAAFAAYLQQVMLLAEATAAMPTQGYVPERILGAASVEAVDAAGSLDLTVKMDISDNHGGGGVATILIGSGSGPDPLAMQSAQSVIGSDFTADRTNSLVRQEELFGEVYGAMVTAIEQPDTNGPPGGWDGFATALNGYSTIFVVPVGPPPPVDPGLWSVDEANDTDRLRATVRSGLSISDPNGVAPATTARWGVQFQQFDNRLAGSTRTFAHEIGHSRGLSDQYPSSKFNAVLKYLDGLDLMGDSGANWPHFCAYHKLALGWFGAADRIVLDPPGEGETLTRRVILVPTEWWRPVLEASVREDAFPSEPESTAVTGAVLCNLGGDGGLLAVVEARSPGEEFSQSIVGASATGRVMISHVLDYGTHNRYGQVLQDVGDDVPADVVDGLLRYRRYIQLLTGNLPAGAPGPAFDLEEAPGFPIPGLRVRRIDESSISVTTDAGPRQVPAFLCEVEWEYRPAADVGFDDNEHEWQSSDIGIDWIGGEGSGDPDAGRHLPPWPPGDPSGVGEEVRVPVTNVPEPHEVMVRVWNFGLEAARNVAVELFLRDPGGGGDPAGPPFDTQSIPLLEPSSQVQLLFPWEVREGQEEHVCWRAQIAGFEVGEGANAVQVVSDAVISNNWAQQNILVAQIPHQSPPEPFETVFSVHNGGPFIETAYLEPRGLPKGVRMRIRPRRLVVPAFSTRHFHIRLEFDEEIIGDPCRRDIDVLVQCWRLEDHAEERWGASLFKLKVRRKTTTSVKGSWFVNALKLGGQVTPGTALGTVSLRLDFQNGQPARWIETQLGLGGVYDTEFDTTGIPNQGEVIVSATYRGSPLYASSNSGPAKVGAYQPAG